MGEIRLDVEAQRATVQPAPQPDPMGTRDVIPTLGGSFDAAQGPPGTPACPSATCWPGGRRPPAAPAAPAAPAEPAAEEADGISRLRVSGAGNTASEPVHTPPRAAAVAAVGPR